MKHLKTLTSSGEIASQQYPGEKQINDTKLIDSPQALNISLNEAHNENN